MTKKTRKKATGKKKKYTCRSCGLVVSVDTACGCLDTCDITCCGEQMAAK